MGAVRLAEIIGALSLAADLASGLPAEKSLRTVLVATRLARAVGLEGDDVFWVAALRLAGCLGFASEEAVYAAGDDNSLRRTLVRADFARPLDVARGLLRGVAPDAPPLARAAALARFATARDAPLRHARATCESAIFFARSVGLPGGVVAALDVLHERHDGKGPGRVRGDALPAAARLVDVADTLELFAWTGGPDLARAVLAQRRGGALDPAYVDAAVGALPELLDGLRGDGLWDAYLAAEPTPRMVDDDDADRAWVALGRFGDLKSVYTLAHSRRVTAIAGTAADAAGLPARERALLRRAACAHDLGRVAVPNAIWDRRGALGALDWQRVRAHSHHTDAVLRGARQDAIADVAGAAHERGRGAGYHRGVPLERVPAAARILAAADVMAALGEDRPHRPALDADRAVRELRALVAAGELDARGAQAVLDAHGATPSRRRAWPGGLSDREVEVVRLSPWGARTARSARCSACRRARRSVTS
jgi:HD-GYP domain-containing protein (c-di-GMP phosphodiesterase class II)